MIMHNYILKFYWTFLVIKPAVRIPEYITKIVTPTSVIVVGIITYGKEHFSHFT